MKAIHSCFEILPFLSASSRSSSCLTFSFAWANLSCGLGATSATAIAPVALISAISKLLRVMINFPFGVLTSRIPDRDFDQDSGIHPPNANRYRGNGLASHRCHRPVGRWLCSASLSLACTTESFSARRTLPQFLQATFIRKCSNRRNPAQEFQFPCPFVRLN